MKKCKHQHTAHEGLENVRESRSEKLQCLLILRISSYVCFQFISELEIRKMQFSFQERQSCFLERGSDYHPNSEISFPLNRFVSQADNDSSHDDWSQVRAECRRPKVFPERSSDLDGCCGPAVHTHRKRSPFLVIGDSWCSQIRFGVDMNISQVWV